MVAGALFDTVKPGAKPGGIKRTAPLPRAVFVTPTMGTKAEVAPAAVNGAFIKTGGMLVLLPAKIAS